LAISCGSDCRLANSQLAAQIRDRYTGFGLSQNPTDLLLAESRSHLLVQLIAVMRAITAYRSRLRRAGHWQDR
jgi:hypothetical protein